MVNTREVTLLAWNVKDGLSDPRRADAIAEKVAAVNPDLALFSEGSAGDFGVRSSAKRILESAGGIVYEADYNDFDDRLDKHRLVALAKPDMGAPAVLPNFGRNGFYFSPPSLPVKIAGLHGLDRDQNDVSFSDEARLRQIRHVLQRLELTIDSQAIILGDLSALHPDDIVANIIRAVSPLFEMLPSKNTGEKQSILEHVGSVSQRLGQMAIGSSLAELQAASFYDADRHHHATVKLGMVGVQLDHIMGKRVELVHDHNIKPDGLSGHSAVVAKARIFERPGYEL